MRKKVLIIGGGFGGIYTAKYLNKYLCENDAEITIINDNNYFLFTPMLHEVATGGLSPFSVTESIREIFRKSRVSFIEAFVRKIDTDSKKVIVSSGEEYSFDYLVVSTGSETNFFGVEGAKEHALVLKNIKDALIIRNKIIDLCDSAFASSNEKEKKKKMTFVVIGGGPTGVELVSEIHDLVRETLCAYYDKSNLKDITKIILINSGQELLQQARPKVREKAYKILKKINVNIKLGAEVKKIGSDFVETKDELIESNCIVWCAGVKAQKPLIENINTNTNGRIEIDQYLRAKDTKNIFVLGDVSNGYPMLAQVAVRQAKVVAYNIRQSIKEKGLTEYKNKISGFLVSFGQWRAVGDIYGIVLSGPFMWWLWRTIYLFKFISWRKRFEIAIEWTIDIFTPRDIIKLK